MYTLILTIICYTGVSVTNVPGYTSEGSCMIAANAWLKQVKPVNEHSSIQKQFALCTKT